VRGACSGPAGENRGRIAGGINDRSRAAARAGGGAVMGSKRLKAIVAHETKPAPAPRPFVQIAGAMARRTHQHPESQALHRWGTPLLIWGKNLAGDLPAYNHQAGQVAFYAQIDAEALDRYVTRHKSCHACPIGCDHETRVPTGPYATELGGPEYETVDALGPMLGLADLEAIIYANRLCNELGLDTISTGVCIAFIMELKQRGLYTDPEFSLAWGDAASVLGLIRAIAGRQGVGDLLADGVKRAAEKLGPATLPYALHVKGMELPRQEPRIAKAFGLGHMTSNRGADHLYALPTVDIASNWEAARALFPAEMLPQLMDLADETYKADLVVYSENYSAVSDALGICKFATTETYALMPEDVAAGLSALRGKPIAAAELLQAGERIVNLERLYNARLGLTRADDRLPERFTAEPLPIYAFTRAEATGEVRQSAQPIHVGLVHDPAAMLDRYYRLRGWDARGLPTAEKLRELGLQVS
jgi:aldehyde:ferredoxin oxidoreductase